MLRKLVTILTSFFALSAGALAAPTSLVPTGFSFGGTGFYVQPQVSGYDSAYGYSQSPNASNNATSYLRQVNTTYRGAWAVNGSYLLANLIDFSGSYFHYNPVQDQGTTQLSNSQTFTTENPQQTHGIGANSTVVGKASWRINQADIAVGKTFISNRTVFHPSLGMRWANITRFFNTYANITNDTLLFFGEPTLYSSLGNTTHERSYFCGGGPVLVIEGSYFVTDAIQLFAHVDGSLLVGRISTNNNVSSGLSFSSVTTSAYSYWAADSVNHIVPIVDLRFAAAYNLHFLTDNYYTAHFEVGYQANHYWNAVDRTLTTGSLNNDGIYVIANINGRAGSKGVGLQGPYVNVTFTIA